MFDKIEWCIVKLMNDYKWWLEKISNGAHTDTDYMGVIDPRQFDHLIELTSPLFDYGLRNDIVEGAFLKLRIAAELPDNRVKLEFTPTKTHSSEEPLFLLPNIIADNEGPYAEFIAHIIHLRVKLLTDSIDSKVPLNAEEIEETLRERYQEKYIEGEWDNEELQKLEILDQ